METPIQSFSIKGAMYIVGAAFLLNVGVMPLLTRLGLSARFATVFVNGLLTSGSIAFVSVYVDGNHERKTFLKRYVLFGMLFGITALLWSMNIFI